MAVSRHFNIKRRNIQTVWLIIRKFARWCTLALLTPWVVINRNFGKCQIAVGCHFQHRKIAASQQRFQRWRPVSPCYKDWIISAFPRAVGVHSTTCISPHPVSQPPSYPCQCWSATGYSRGPTSLFTQLTSTLTCTWRPFPRRHPWSPDRCRTVCLREAPNSRETT